jgi:uncharacterized protein (DUF3820 family)
MSLHLVNMVRFAIPNDFFLSNSSPNSLLVRFSVCCLIDFFLLLCTVGVRLEDVPRPYVQFLLNKEVWRNHPDLWHALAKMGVVLETPPDSSSRRTIRKTNTSQSSNSDANNISLQASARISRSSSSSSSVGTRNSNDHDHENSATTASTEMPPKKLKDVDYVFDFGKHKGRSWEAVPEDYRDWLLREKVWKSQARKNLLDALTNAGYPLGVGEDSRTRTSE